jgi:sterol desaturase/sphingolipid hydroxylase (fatty acid hydroxylase superfamily)
MNLIQFVFSFKNLFLFFLFWGVWTLVEYLFHRFILHRKYFTKYIHDNKHHTNVKFKPSEIPFFIVSLTLIFFAFIPNFQPALLGFSVGMLVYVSLHKLSHQRSKIKYLKSHHQFHHVVSPKFNFGISTDFWDIVFGTKKNVDFLFDEKREKIYFE